LTKSWYSRDQYGVILSKVIKKQVGTFNRAKDSHIKIKLASSISNLVHTQNTMINDYEGRIDLKAVEEILKENARLLNQINAKSQRNAHDYLNSEQQKEQAKFLKLSSAKQKEYQKKCEIEMQDKGQTYSEVLP